MNTPNHQKRIDDLEIANLELAAINAELKASEQNYRRLFESMTDAYVSVDMAGHIQETNRSYQAMLGYSEAELKGLTYSDLTPGKWHAAEARIVKEQVIPLGYSTVYEKEYRRKDGTLFPIELHTFLLRDDAGKPSGMWAIIRDITERKHAEAVLHEAEWKFQALFTKGPIGVAYHEMIYDASGNPSDYRFLDANPCYLELTGVDPRGKTVKQAFPGIENDPFDWIGTFGNVARTGKQLRIEQYLT